MMMGVVMVAGGDYIFVAIVVMCLSAQLCLLSNPFIKTRTPCMERNSPCQLQRYKQNMPTASHSGQCLCGIWGGLNRVHH